MLNLDSRLLAQHPDVLAKLREEINSIVGVGKESRLPDRNSLKRMKYMNLVLKEGMSVLARTWSPHRITSKIHS